MPSGNTHNKINFLFLPPFLLFLIFMGFSSFKYAFIFSVGFVFGTLYLDPDLDLKGKSYKRWGIFKFIWIPYQKVFPHRSVFTHGLIVGDIIRVFYLITWLVMLFYIPSTLFNYFVEPLFYTYFPNINSIIITTCIFLCLITILHIKYMKRDNSKLLVFVVLLIVWFLNSTKLFSLPNWVVGLYKSDSYNLLFMLPGLILSSTLHVVSDIVVSSVKKLLK